MQLLNDMFQTQSNQCDQDDNSEEPTVRTVPSMPTEPTEPSGPNNPTSKEVNSDYDSYSEDDDSESDQEDDTNNHEIVVPGCGEPKFDAKKHPYYAKSNYCFVCEKSISRLDKHLPRVHKDDENVKRVFSMDAGRQKKDQQQLLINRGNFNHNIAVLKVAKCLVI